MQNIKNLMKSIFIFISFVTAENYQILNLNQIFKKTLEAKTKKDFEFYFDHLFKEANKNPHIKMPIKYWFWWISSNISALKLVILKTAKLDYSPFETYIFVKKILSPTISPIEIENLSKNFFDKFFVYTDKTFNNDVLTLCILYRNTGALIAILENMYNQRDIQEIMQEIPESLLISLDNLITKGQTSEITQNLLDDFMLLKNHSNTREFTKNLEEARSNIHKAIKEFLVTPQITASPYHPLVTAYTQLIKQQK